LTQPGPEGLQAERTALAWGRTSLAVLVNGILLILKDPRHYDGPLPVVGAGFAVVIAVTVYLIGRRRQRILAQRPLPDRITARVELELVGVAVLVLIVVTALGLFL
jgi:uncharacterized membrane protein YidH (DUF202 family)